jgi:hypothetical protein
MFPAKNTLLNPQNGLQRSWSLNPLFPLFYCPTSTPQNAQQTASLQLVKKNPAAAN